mgnify:CR=1 FL=1
MKDMFFEEYRNLGLSIAYFRRAKGITQQQLADLLDINCQTVSRMENANTGISADMLFALSKALDIKLGDLFAHANL